MKDLVRWNSASSDGLAKLSSANPDMAEGSDTLEIQYDGPDIKDRIQFAIFDGFSCGTSAEEVILELNTESTAALMKPKGTDQFDYRYILMPMRL